MTTGRALVTGASGYIGGQLVGPLLEAGWTVRVLTRSAAGVSEQPWYPRVETVVGDATDEADVRAALTDVDVAYYLLHSMDGRGDFTRRDRVMAGTFASAAGNAGVRRIVYLSGIHPPAAEDVELSAHLGSRAEVGEIFLDGPAPAAVLQAAVVLGRGSTSFDMLRYLTDRLPAMIAPRWLHSRIQPIAIADVLHYLVGAATLPTAVNRTFDIAGPDVLTYEDMIQRFAALTGQRRRLIVTVPVLTVGLASHWVGFVTPVSPGVAKPLVGSLIHDVVAHENDLDALVGAPPGGGTGFDEAVRTAMRGVPHAGGAAWVPQAVGGVVGHLAGSALDGVGHLTGWARGRIGAAARWSRPADRPGRMR